MNNCLIREYIRKRVLGVYEFIFVENLMDFLVFLKFFEILNFIFIDRVIFLMINVLYIREMR